MDDLVLQAVKNEIKIKNNIIIIIIKIIVIKKMDDLVLQVVKNEIKIK